MAEDRPRREPRRGGEGGPRGDRGPRPQAASGSADRRPPASTGRGRERGEESRSAANRLPGGPDPARRAALDTLLAVDSSDAYANLVLPPLLAERRIRGRDAAFATELAYGTLRLRGRYDAILTRASSRPLDRIDPPVLDALRLGAHQLLGMRVPPHAAVAETVALARAVGGHSVGGFVNAVLRTIADRPAEDWLAELAEDPDPDGALAAVHSHPPWVVRALRSALVGNGRSGSEIVDLLNADNQAPSVTLVARTVTPEDLFGQAHAARLPEPLAGRFAPTAVQLRGGDPAALPAVRSGAAGVQDEGSQLVTLAASGVAPAAGDRPARWLDLCAGPGGKAALLAARLAERPGGGLLVANELHPHRAELVRRSVRGGAGVEVRVGDGRDIGAAEPASYDLVLLDAPCTGLGALRRRPEARWRRTPTDVGALTALQRDLLDSALRATAPGGVVAYLACSPHLAETHAIVDDARRRAGVEVLDAVAAVQAVATAPVPDLGPGPYLQLWPHLHGTDAMFLALLRVGS